MSGVKETEKENTSNVDYEVHILEEKENVVFNRKEVKGQITSSGGTPSRAYVFSFLSSKYKVPDTHIDLRYILNKKGRRICEFFALIYKNPIQGTKENTKEVTKNGDE